MKKLVIVVFLIIIESIVYAQNVVHVIRLNPDSALKNIRFSCLEVLDARTNKENIGFAIGNANAIAQLEGDFTGHLKTSLDKMLPQEEGKLGLIVIFREIEISEKTESSSKLGLCKIEIEFAKRVDTTLYSLGVFDAHIIGKGADVTKSHESRILLGLEECLRKLDETNWENAKEFIIEDIHHKLVYDYKSVPPKGAYLSFEQMVRGTPLDSVDLNIRQFNASKKYPTYGIRINKKDSPRKVLFVSDGENIYLRLDKDQYVKSRVYGKYIYFQGSLPSSIDPSMGVSFYLTTGLLGAALVSVGSGSSMSGIVLETETGNIKGVTDFYIVNATKPYPEIMKEYRASKRNLEAKENVIKQLNSKF